MKKHLLLLFLYAFLIGGVSQSRAQVLENYDLDLSYGKQPSWFQSSKIIQVSVDIKSFPQSSFRIMTPGQSTVFVNNTLWFYTSKDTVITISIPRLETEFGLQSFKTVDLSMMKKDIKVEDVSVLKGFFSESFEAPKTYQAGSGIEKREISRFYDFFFVSLIIILFIIGLYKLVYPLVLAYIIDPQSLLTAEDFSETNAIQKFFSLDIIFYVIIVNLLMALSVMVGIKELNFKLLLPMVEGGVKELFFYWLILTLILFVVTVVKFLFIKFMTFVYDLGKNEFSHFFYLLRIVSILLVIFASIISYFALNSPDNLSVVSSFAFLFFFWGYILGVFFLMLIMMKRVSFNNYHLFAYICTAELVPFLIISKLIIG